MPNYIHIILHDPKLAPTVSTRLGSPCGRAYHGTVTGWHDLPLPVNRVEATGNVIVLVRFLFFLGRREVLIVSEFCGKRVIPLLQRSAVRMTSAIVAIFANR